MPAADLTLFAHVASRPEAELDLALAALLIAEPDYPGLDIPHYVDVLDQLGEQARRRLDEPPRTSAEADEPPLRRIARLLHDDLGFSGNSDDYYDPRNSFLNEVLDRRTGIPITLAVVILEVAHRAGIQAHGVSFPGHFLVRSPVPSGTLFIDPFDGRVATPARLRELNARTSGESRDPDPRVLEPTPKKQILIRMLNNLRGIYAAAADADRLRRILALLQLLTPTSTPSTPPRTFN
jgi:regulator of sirC expression with transglutaminase-like and TPR domain